jgi:hypothetical protein
MYNSLKPARLLANGASTILTILLILVWPSLMILEGVFDLAAFKRWVSIHCNLLTIKATKNCCSELKKKIHVIDGVF